MIIITSLVVIFITFKSTASAQHCQTPKGQNGDCVLLPNCASLFARFQERPLTRSTANYLRQSNCGFEGLTPKVCCPIKKDPLVKSVANLLPLDTCGRGTQTRVIGGDKTELDEFPWMALLEYENRTHPEHRKFRCGGALISKRYVLTAAHCVHEEKLSLDGWNLKRVRLGEYDTDSDIDCTVDDDCAPPVLNVEISERIVHENYIDDYNQYNDIALIRLNQDVAFSDYVKPICLPVKKEDLDSTHEDDKLFVAGWGKTENRSYSNVKLKVQLPAVELARCSSIYSVLFKKPKLGQICAGGVRSKDSCGGDSGGPLMTVKFDAKRDVRWQAVGLVSYGPSPCGMHNWPAVYTRTGSYIDWILSKLK